MGFLDSLRDKFDDMRGRGDDGYDGYDDEYDDGYSYSRRSRGAESQGDAGDYYAPEPSNGLLGQTRRGEAESVAVYTRSGELVGGDERHATNYGGQERSVDAYRPGAYDTPSSIDAGRARGAVTGAGVVTTRSGAPASALDDQMTSIVNGTPQLPAYILKPESYDDVETVVRRVRTKQPVALVFQGVRTEVAKRVLDFSYGFACGSGAAVREAGDRVFMVLPMGCEVKESDLAKLRSMGYLS